MRRRPVLFLCHPSLRHLFLYHSERREESRIFLDACRCTPCQYQSKRSVRGFEQGDQSMVEGAYLRIAPGILRCTQNDTDGSCGFAELLKLLFQQVSLPAERLAALLDLRPGFRICFIEQSL